MSANYGKLDAAQREKVFDLKEKGLSGKAVAAALAKGWPDEVPPISPVEVSGQGVNDLYRRQKRERDLLYGSHVSKLSNGAGLDVLTRRLLVIADRETQRQEEKQKRGKLDGTELGRLVGAVERLHKLCGLRFDDPDPSPPPAPGESPAPARASTLADRLLDGELEPGDGAAHVAQADRTAASGAPPVADVPVSA